IQGIGHPDEPEDGYEIVYCLMARPGELQTAEYDNPGGNQLNYALCIGLDRDYIVDQASRQKERAHSQDRIEASKPGSEREIPDYKGQVDGDASQERRWVSVPTIVPWLRDQTHAERNRARHLGEDNTAQDRRYAGQ